MRAITHIAASTAAAAVAGATSGTSAAAGILLFGGFLDVDHLTHLISVGLPSSPQTFFKSIFMNEKQLEKKYSISRGVPSSWAFPVLHCIEFVFLLAVSGFLLKSSFLMAAEHSYGFRSGRSAQMGVLSARQFVADGWRWVVDMDLEKFFDRVHTTGFVRGLTAEPRI